jgi:hypothetical protein
MQVVVPPGSVLTICFSDEAGQLVDGSFEVHHDSKEHPMTLLIQETAGLPGSVKGGANEILYEEFFGAPPEVLAMVPSPNGTYMQDYQRWPDAEKRAIEESRERGFAMVCECPPGLYHVFAGGIDTVHTAVDEFVNTFVASLEIAPTPALEAVATFVNGVKES